MRVYSYIVTEVVYLSVDAHRADRPTQTVLSGYLGSHDHGKATITMHDIEIKRHSISTWSPNLAHPQSTCYLTPPADIQALKLSCRLICAELSPVPYSNIELTAKDLDAALAFATRTRCASIVRTLNLKPGAGPLTSQAEVAGCFPNLERLSLSGVQAFMDINSGEVFWRKNDVDIMQTILAAISGSMNVWEQGGHEQDILFTHHDVRRIPGWRRVHLNTVRWIKLDNE